MHLTALEDIFQQWVTAATELGVSVRHTHSLNDVADGLVLITALFSAGLDPERRVRPNMKKNKASRPLARMRYVVALRGATQATQAEQVLISVLTDVERQTEMKALSEPVAASWWLAQGVSPLPAFHLEVRITEDTLASDAPLIEDHVITMEGR